MKTPFNSDTFTIKAELVKEGWFIWVDCLNKFRKVIDVYDEIKDGNGLWLSVDVSDDPKFINSPWKQKAYSIEVEPIEPAIFLKEI
ncbi:hypothetical protein [Enterobacter kobei]|uniref:hypothetical protein n=1 Tax=Enterobacter kobei TaxID=208224 RepID=UPI002020AD4D|nr:hypothetical protein [Enterobacter kobei]MCL8167141.1 hypothetical protein [Enterobacter kobei]MCM7795637.1 hypothetical protein [Enterobacter kobei]